MTSRVTRGRRPWPSSTRPRAASGSPRCRSGCRRSGTSMRHDHDDESVVVVPSVSGRPAAASAGAELQAFEERFLFLLLLLRQPALRMIYVTSMPIEPTDHRVLPGAAAGGHPEPRPGPADAGVGRRLDAAPAQREAARAAAAARGRSRRGSPTATRCHLIPYNTTERERDVALTLGIPMYGADPRLCRPRQQDRLPSAVRARRACRTRSAPRTCTPATTVVDAIRRCCAERPSIAEVIVKLNEGVSGTGNALVDLRGLAGGRGDGERRCAERVRAMLSWSRRPHAATSTGTVRARRRHRRGADRRRRAAQPERAAAGPARRRASSCCPPTTSCSAAQRPELPRLRVPGRPGVLAADQRAGGGRSASGWPRRASSAGSRSTSSSSATTTGDWTRVRDRAEPAQGRHHAPVPDPAVPDRRSLRRPRRAGSSRRTATRSTWSRPTTSRRRRCARCRVDDLFDVVARHGLHFDQSRADRRRCST